MITVALPTWNNKDIVWLAMEGLVRQKNSPEWELLILECRSLNEAGADFFRSYWNKLQKAGCVRMKYAFCESRMPLNQKWVKLAKEAHPESEMFLIQASDDYPHPERNEQPTKHNVDWYDCRSYYSYHIGLDKLLLFDNQQTDANKPGEWKTGFNMAIKTDLVRNIKSDQVVRKGVDFWLFNTAGAKSRYVDQKIYNGLSTTGLNTISNKRYKYFNDVKFPFKETEVRPEDLKIPKSILKRLYELKPKATVSETRLNYTPIMVEFIKKINGKQPGHRQKIPAHAVDYFLLRNAIKVIYHGNEPQKDFELCI